MDAPFSSPLSSPRRMNIRPQRLSTPQFWVILCPQWKMEGSHSGLVRATGNRVGGQTPRGFKSLPFRHTPSCRSSPIHQTNALAGCAKSMAVAPSRHGAGNLRRARHSATFACASRAFPNPLSGGYCRWASGQMGEARVYCGLRISPSRPARAARSGISCRQGRQLS